jgi:hypothetical protein
MSTRITSDLGFQISNVYCELVPAIRRLALLYQIIVSFAKQFSEDITFVLVECLSAEIVLLVGVARLSVI